MVREQPARPPPYPADKAPAARSSCAGRGNGPSSSSDLPFPLRWVCCCSSCIA